MTLMERLEAEQAHFTAREHDIAQYLTQNYPQAILQSASAIARATGISPPTVVRFFAKLGYDSFAEAQEEIRREVVSKLHSPVDRIGLPDSSERSAADLLARHAAAEATNLRATFGQIDPDGFAAAVAAVSESRGRVYVIGEKDSYAIAYFLFSHLNLCRRDVVLLETGQAMLADRLLWSRPDDVLICVSIRRYSPNSRKVAGHFRDMGAAVVVLTDTPLSPLMPFATHRLLAQTASLSVFDSFTALMSVAGALVGEVARLSRESMQDSLNRGQDLWRRFDTFLN
ncbi:MurR/RpiR family transcriptional regulator [Enterovirga rhinocerotis]|uniref:RpiR family transcriptional regulator n=1 Tax=Enterovirga rhinocerotis TaxID=1339210 RepID=A0A4R7BN75_9HYPH|nr:MurR/RpiR family transcriptional regulator [Enterovirga rhinocerotis]TDR85377.1 RpiR family transcriptional regulator [Enterovirga rhinocerotis]